MLKRVLHRPVDAMEQWLVGWFHSKMDVSITVDTTSTSMRIKTAVGPSPTGMVGANQPLAEPLHFHSSYEGARIGNTGQLLGLGGNQQPILHCTKTLA